MNETLKDIQEECKDLQAELEVIIPDNADLAIERGKIIAVYIGRSGHLLATAKRIARRKKASEISDVIVKIAKENYLSAKAQNALIDSIADEEMFLVDTLGRINASFTHQLDFIRTIISFEKENLRIAKTGY